MALLNAAVVVAVRLTSIRRALAVCLALACAGVIVQIPTGVSYPKIPPGPIILGAAVLVVGFVSWRWISALGLVVAAFLTVGAVASGTTLPRLGQVTPVGPFVGTWLQLAAQVAAVVLGVAGVVAAARGSRRR